MKQVKRIFALVLASLLAMATALPALAATTGSITLSGAKVGETYNIYKVFDLTYGGSATSYTYTSSGEGDTFLAKLQEDTSPFSVSATTTANKYTVTKKSTALDSDISTFLNTNFSSLSAYTGATKEGFYTGDNLETTEVVETEDMASATTVKWSGLDLGYYYVTSSLGSAVVLTNTKPNATISEKNTVPSQTKTQVVHNGTGEPAADSYKTDQLHVQIGDIIYYQIEIADGKTTDKVLTIDDVMTSGLTFNDNVTVTYQKSGASELPVDAASYTLTKDTATNSFKIVFDANFIKTIDEGDKIYIRYTATVNQNATSISSTTETNTSTLTYSAQKIPKSVSAVTYKFQLNKFTLDSSNVYQDLYGAVFEIYRGSRAADNKVWFVKGADDNGVPTLIVAGMGANAPSGVSGALSEIRLTEKSTAEGDGKDIDTNSLNSTKVIIKGLGYETYVIHETDSPDGYNLADDITISNEGAILKAITVKIEDNDGANNDTGVLNIENNSGTEIPVPATGGIGTTIFYVLGGILLVGAGILLVTKRRMNSAK